MSEIRPKDAQPNRDDSLGFWRARASDSKVEAWNLSVFAADFVRYQVGKYWDQLMRRDRGVFLPFPFLILFVFWFDALQVLIKRTPRRSVVAVLRLEPADDWTSLCHGKSNTTAFVVVTRRVPAGIVSWKREGRVLAVLGLGRAGLRVGLGIN